MNRVRNFRLALLGFVLLLTAQSSFGLAAFDGLVNVASGINLYAHVAPGNPSAPTIVLLNGLTQDVDMWSSTVPYLESKGANVITIDLALQGRSMMNRLSTSFSLTRPVVPPLILSGGLWSQQPTFPNTTVETQAQYVVTLLKKLGVQTKVVLAGLSYGGGLAFQMAHDYPNLVQEAILAAPYVFPLPQTDAEIKIIVADTQTLYPAWDMVPYDDVYDLILRGLIISTDYEVEPEILKWDPPFQSIGVAELTRGIRHMSYPALMSGIKVPLHLIMAGDDQYIPADMLLKFWSSVPTSIKGSMMTVVGSEHKMNEAVGPFFGSWIWQLASDPQYVSKPGTFNGFPLTGVGNEVGGSNRVVQLQATPLLEVWHLPASGWPWEAISQNPMAAIPGLVTSGNPLPSSP